jgi:hypothetical protein
MGFGAIKPVSGKGAKTLQREVKYFYAFHHFY